LFIVNTASGASDENSKWFLKNEARIFRENNPGEKKTFAINLKYSNFYVWLDARLMFWTSGNKERFRDLVLNPEKDLFLLTQAGLQAPPDVKQVVSRLTGCK
jgi:hypothetical protein